MEYLTDEDYEIAKSNGISKKNAYNRFYKAGWTKKDTITRQLHVNNHFEKKVLELYPNYMDILSQTGIAYTTFYHRVKDGKMDIKTALFTPSKKKKNTVLSKENIETAERNGISKDVLKARVYRMKWSMERAISEPIRSKNKYGM